MQKEAEILSSAEYLHKESIFSLVNQTDHICASPGCKGAKDAHQPQDDLKKEGWAK